MKKKTEKKMQRFIGKWSNWWIMNKNKDKLNEAFEKELRQIIKNVEDDAEEEYEREGFGVELA